MAKKERAEQTRTAAKRYEAHKTAMAEKARANSTAGRDIGDLPPVVDQARRDACAKSLRLFCETYHSETFYLPWSQDHLRVIARIEQVVLAGGQFAIAMPRGSGKTTLCEVACEWAVLYGYHVFVVLIGAEMGHAKEMLDSIKTDFESNPLLLEDFPEAVYPIHKLEGIGQRAGAQLYQGELTHISWTEDVIVLPTIQGAAASGAIIKVAGLTGRIRGMKHKRHDGKTVRPTLVLPDDPQTDESAKSPLQNEQREKILAKSVLYLAGPARKIAALMPCTVIEPDDMADRILDRQRNPDWNGERTKMVYTFPTDEKLWARYAELRGESLRRHGDIREATAFYAANRAAMDAGAVVAWPERFNPDELSAVQNAMNLRIKNEPAFWAECQNEPRRGDVDAGKLTVEAVIQRVNGRRRGEVPLAATRLTAFADLHDAMLYWTLCAWEDNGTGSVVDYGVYPDQGMRHFSLSGAKKTLGRLFKGMTPEAALQAGLEKVVVDLLAKSWKRAGAAGLARLDRLHVDIGYKPEIVAAVKLKAGGAVMHLQKGIGITAGKKPIATYQKRPGWQIGHFWYSPSVRGTREFQHIVADANYWKSWVHDHLQLAPGAPGALTLFQATADEHQLFAEHIAASEFWTPTAGYGRTVREWKQFPQRPDNHWLDCLAGCAVAAAIAGIKVAGEAAAPVRERKHYTQADFRRPA